MKSLIVLLLAVNLVLPAVVTRSKRKADSADLTELTAVDFENAEHIPEHNMTREESSHLNETEMVNSHLSEGDIMEEKGARRRRYAVVPSHMKWPNGRVPYKLSNSYNAQERAEIAAAFQSYHRHTCIRFVPAGPNDEDYIFIRRLKGCYSYLGKIGGEQEVSFGNGCLHKGIIMHELMHALGFAHEQCRSDRDHFVEVRRENIKPDMQSNFQIYQNGDTLGAPYDYGSMMHYGVNYFTKNGQPTLVPRHPGVTIGQRKGFSKWDLHKIIKFYNCPNPIPAQCQNAPGCRYHPNGIPVDPSLCPELFDVCD